MDLSKRLIYVQKLRARLDEAWGLNQVQRTQENVKNSKIAKN